MNHERTADDYIFIVTHAIYSLFCWGQYHWGEV